MTFCFTDIVGSTELHARTSETQYATLLERHREILRAAWGAHRGVEVNTEGDGCFVVFAEVADAVEACGEAQRGLAAEPWSPGFEVSVRMGIHSGEAEPTADDDYSAFAVHQAARIAAAGNGGQVLVSAVSARLWPSDKLRALGRFRVRDFVDPVELYELTPNGAKVFGPLRGVGSLDPVAAIDVPPFLRFAGAWPFQGRVDDLEAGRRTLVEALSGVRRCIIVGGEPGVGKTRLAGELAREARRLGMVVLGGRCETEMVNPFAPITDVFREVVAALDPTVVEHFLGRWPEELVRLVPELPDVIPGLGRPLVSDPDTERWRLLDAIVSALTDLSAPGGLVLVIDDAQWASPATASVIRHLLRPDLASGLVPVVTFRDTEPTTSSAWSELVGDFARIDGLHRLALSGLDASSIRALVDSIACDEIMTAGADFAEALTRTTAGNPYFAGELIRHLVETGEIVAHNEQSISGGDIDRLTLPSEVRDVILRRVERVGRSATAVLQAGAVIGSDFDTPSVRAIVPDVDDPLDDLEGAVAAGLLTEVGIERWRFVHRLVRSTVYGEMSRSRRAIGHRRLAERLELDADSEAAVLARHWGLATGPDAPGRAARWSMQAGRDAMARLAPHEAQAHFRAALDHDSEAAESGFDESERIIALIALGTAQRRMGDPESSATLWTAATDARDHDHPELMAEATVASSRGFWNSLGDSDDARVQMIEDALHRLPADDSPLRARLLACLAAELLFHPRRADRFALADESLAMARRLDDDDVTFDVMTHRFLCTASPDRLDRYWHETADLLDRAGRIGDPHREILAMMVRYFIGNLSGHVRDAANLPVDATAKADELGQPMLRWLSGAMSAGLRIFEGQLDEGERVATDAFGLGQLAGEADALVWLSGQLTAIRIEQARVGEIIDLIGDFVATTPQLRVWSAAYAFALCELERFDEAREVFEELAGDGFSGVSYDQLWVAALCFATEACRHVGHPTAAQHLYDLLAPWEHLAASVTVFSLGTVARSLGVLATMLGDLDGAEAHLRRAIDRNTHDQSPIWTANARLDLAEVYVLRGGAEAAELVRSLANLASRDIDGLGAERIQRRVTTCVGSL